MIKWFKYQFRVNSIGDVTEKNNIASNIFLIKIIFSNNVNFIQNLLDSVKHISLARLFRNIQFY